MTASDCGSNKLGASGHYSVLRLYSTHSTHSTHSTYSTHSAHSTQSTYISTNIRTAQYYAELTEALNIRSLSLLPASTELIHWVEPGEHSSEPQALDTDTLTQLQEVTITIHTFTLSVYKHTFIIHIHTLTTHIHPHHSHTHPHHSQTHPHHSHTPSPLT